VNLGQGSLNLQIARSAPSARGFGLSGCALAAGIGLAAVGGWLVGAPRLYAWTGGAAATKPFSAVAAIALAAAVVASLWPESPRARAAGCLLAAATLVVSAPMLVENLAGTGIGIDGLLFGGSVSAHRLGGRMAQNTALAFVLLAVAVLARLRRSARAVLVVECTSMVAVAVGLVGGGGYLFGPRILAAVSGYATMSLGTAVALVALGASVIAVEDRSRVRALLTSSGPAGRATRSLLVPISVIPLVIGAAVAESGLTLDQARTAAWLFAVALAGLLVVAVLAIGLVEQRREGERARLDAELETAHAHARRQRTLEMVVAAAEEERNQIATDLHDDTIQVMTAALLTIDRARASVAGGDPLRAARALGRARSTLEDAVERTRRLMFELRPPALSERGLRAALLDLATETGAATGADVAVEVIDVRLPDHVEGLAYRTVRELVANARRHARARRIAIAIETAGETLYGVVHDDGVGFDPAAVRARPGRHLHLGLDAVEQRVVLAGGSLEIDSAPMRGARVAFAIPLAAEPAA
jgi:signal transduction histidine kinase